MVETAEKRSEKNFFKFAFEPEQLLIFVVTIVAFVISLFGVAPWFSFRCFFQNTAQSECTQARSELNNSIILFLLGILSLNSIIERYKTFQDLENNVADLQKILRDASFKRQIIPIRGSQQWYETAYQLIEDAENYIYDASLSSRSWYSDSPNIARDRFNASREKAFCDREIDTRYLITVKSYLEDEQFQQYRTGCNTHLKEYELQIYRDKLEADIQRLKLINEMLAPNKGYINFSAAYLPGIELEHPLLSFLVVDRKKVLLGFYLSEFQESDISKDNALLIDNEEIATLFTEYFSFLWSKASIEFAHNSGQRGHLKVLLEHLEQQLYQLT